VLDGSRITQPGGLEQPGPLKEWTEPYTVAQNTLVAQGTNTPGYTANQGGSSIGCHVFESSVWETDLTGSKLEPGSAGSSRGQFKGSVVLDALSESRGYVPTLRSEHLQANWRIAILVDNCSRWIYMPVVVVDSVTEPRETETGSMTNVPWLHHEKYTFALQRDQSYEAPALGTVVPEA